MGNSLPVMTEQIAQACEKFGLNDATLGKLYKQFQSLDKMNMGALDMNDFYAGIGLKRNFFGDSVFKLVDLDDDSEISFYEFIVAACSYCSFTDQQILRFCFDMFDSDKSGYLEEAEVRHLVTILHTLDTNSRKSDSNIRKAMEDFGADEHGRVSYDQFLVINKLYPRLFYPAFQVQLRLQHVTLGPAWYEKKQDAMREKRVLLQQQERAKAEEQKRREEEEEQLRRALEEDDVLEADLDDPYGPNRKLKPSERRARSGKGNTAENAAKPCGCFGEGVAELIDDLDFRKKEEPQPETRLEARMRNVKAARSKSGSQNVMQVDEKDAANMSEDQITRIMKNRAQHRKSKQLSANRSARVKANQLAKGRDDRRGAHVQRTGASSVFEKRR